MKNCHQVAQELMVVERAAWRNPRVRRILKAAPLVVMFLLLNSRTSHAACSFKPAPDPTVDGSPHSLRHAIQMANASGQNCLIQLQAGTYTLTIRNTNGQDNTAAEGDLDITDSGHTVTIQGAGGNIGPGATIVSGNHIDRVFQVLAGANAVFSKLTIAGGVAEDDGTAGALPGTTVAEGGGLLVQNGGHVSLSNVLMRGNQAIAGAGASGTSKTGRGASGKDAQGGGIFLSSGMVNLTDSKVAQNAVTAGSGGSGYNSHCSFHGTIRTCIGHAGPGGVGGAAAGGGLYVASGIADLSRSTVSGNYVVGANGGMGGGVFGPTTDGYESQSGGNGGLAQGAGLFIASGDLNLAQTTVSGNSDYGGPAGGGLGSRSSGNALGAGIFVGTANVSLANSTIFANTAIGGNGSPSRFSGVGGGGNAAGGGLYLSHGSISLKGVTLASNQVLARSVESGSRPGTSHGGGISNAGAGLFINTTLIGNNAQDSGSPSNGNDVFGTITSSYSLIGQRAGAAITDDGGNIFDVNPLLDPGGLKFNGGPTQTVALEQGSPADGTGDNSVCTQAPPTGLGGIDQRGIARFRHGDELCDIGAFEFLTLLVEPTSLSLGVESVGQQTPPKQLSITNNQRTSVTVGTSIAGTDPLDFEIVSSTCGGSLASNRSCTIGIDFRP
ncbi:MAG: hypothetical protein JO189_10485, partial [Deltaproteobacteria bacterium]|nr:hypothetical protein [Deltaproteobacteria bacterium]